MTRPADGYRAGDRYHDAEGPRVTFRIYPEPGTRYVLVHVWPSRAAYVAHRRRCGIRVVAGEQASCMDLHVQRFVRGRWRRTGIVAEVNFHRRRIGTEVVTHEFFHATLAWGRRVGVRWGAIGSDAGTMTVDEERLCYAHGRLCREFVTAATAVGLYS